MNLKISDKKYMGCLMVMELGVSKNAEVLYSSSKVTGNNNTETELPGTVESEDAAEENRDSESPINSKASSSSSSREGSRVESAKPLAFEVPGVEDASLIKRHPPLRFRKLEEQQVEINQEMINLKQAEAEKRRSAIIQERAN